MGICGHRGPAEDGLLRPCNPCLCKVEVIESLLCAECGRPWFPLQFDQIRCAYCGSTVMLLADRAPDVLDYRRIEIP